MNPDTIFHQVIIVGAGPGGLSVAADLKKAGITDVLMLEKGDVGQSWLDYPTDTHLLSESKPGDDDNMIAGVDTSAVFPNIPHPNHVLYQKYLAYVAKTIQVQVQGNTLVTKVHYDPASGHFFLTTRDEKTYEAQFLVWSGGMFSTPNDEMDCEGCYIHYAHLPYMEHITSPEITVVGSANGASGVIMQLARPGRVVTLVTSREYKVPQPIDCLWKEDMQFVMDLSKQGLVKIIENFRVKRIFAKDGHYILESESEEKVESTKKPILCTGFSPNISPLGDLVAVNTEGRDKLIDLDDHHQSKKTPGLYVAGAIGRSKEEEATISKFRDYGKGIAEDIIQKINSK
jgi:putative flavoprotein involved in K+ transport